jgi:hypothetical protein
VKVGEENLEEMALVFAEKNGLHGLKEREKRKKLSNV